MRSRLIASALLAVTLTACADSPLDPTSAAASAAASRGSSATPSTTPTARVRVYAFLTPPSGAPYSSANGKASWDSRNGNAKRELELEVEHLPAGLAVEFFVNGVSVGSRTSNSLGKADIEFSTELGQPVPVSVAGSTAEVRTAAGAVIVTGGFAP